MIGQKLIEAAGSGISTGEVAEAIDFDGTNDYLSRSSDLTGNADGKTFTFSCWVWPNGNNTKYLYLATDSISNNRFYIRIQPNGGGGFDVSAKGCNSSFSTIFEILNVSSVPAETWSSLIISFNNATNTMWVSVNDIASSYSDPFTSTADLKFTFQYHYVGVYSTDELKGRLSNVYLDYTYRDLSVEANRRLFVTADLKPADGQASLNPILYLPMDDPTAPGANAGTGGDFTLTGTVARSGRGPNQYNAPYSDLDGSADYLSRTTAPTGIADGKQATIAFSFNTDVLSNDQTVLTCSSSNSYRFRVQIAGSGKPSALCTIVGRDSTPTTVLSCDIPFPSTKTTNRNYVVVVSFDLSNALNRHFYVNGESVSPTFYVYTDANIDFETTTTPRYRVGASADSTPVDWVNGRLGALWFNTSYIDLSQASNLAKFVTGTGIDAKPVDLGASGELPTGTSPLIYLPMYGNNAGKNYGTGGDFTVNSGPYTGARGPNEFWGNKAEQSSISNRLSKSYIFQSPTASISFWVKVLNTGTAPAYALRGDTSGAFTAMSFEQSGTSLIAKFQDEGTGNFCQAVVDTFSNLASYKHVCFSRTGSTWQLYVDGVSKSFTGTISGLASFKTANWYILNFVGDSRFGVAEVYATTEYIDFSQEANRLKFRDAFGNPVDLTQQIEDAAIPNPAIYMRFPPTSFGTNSGTGGNFTVNGTITDGGQL